MKAITEGQPGDAEEVLKGLIEAGRLFEAESAAQEIGRELTFKELTTIATVCRQNGDNDKAEVALQMAEKAAING